MPRCARSHSGAHPPQLLALKCSPPAGFGVVLLRPAGQEDSLGRRPQPGHGLRPPRARSSGLTAARSVTGALRPRVTCLIPFGSPDCLGLRALSPTGSPLGGHDGCPDASTVLGLAPLRRSGGLPTMRARSPGSRLDLPGTGSVPSDHTGTSGCVPPAPPLPGSFYFSAGPVQCT